MRVPDGKASQEPHRVVPADALRFNTAERSSMRAMRPSVAVVVFLVAITACTARPSEHPIGSRSPSPTIAPTTGPPATSTATPPPEKPAAVRFTRMGDVIVVDHSTTIATVERCSSRTAYEFCTFQLTESTDGGTTWRDITPPGPLDDAPFSASFADPLHGWVVASDCAGGRGELFRTSDGGASWHASLSDSSTCNAGAGIFPDLVEPQVGYLIHAEPTGSFTHLNRSSDGGATWSRTIELPEAGPVAWTDFISSREGWLTGWAYRGRGVWHSVDAGTTWQPVNVPLPERCQQVDRATFRSPSFFGDAGVLPVTCARGRRWSIGFDVTPDGGRTWRVADVLHVRMGSGRGWPALAAGAGAWWVGGGDTVWVTFDGGESWREAPTPRGTVVGGLTPIDGDSAWLVAKRGRDARELFRTDDGGRSWQRVRPDTATGTPRAAGDLWYGRIPVAATCPSGPFAPGRSAAELRATAEDLLRAADGEVPDARAVWHLMDRSLHRVFGQFAGFRQLFAGTPIPGGIVRWHLREAFPAKGKRLPGPYPGWLRQQCTARQLANLRGSWWAINARSSRRWEVTLTFLQRPGGLRLWAVR